MRGNPRMSASGAVSSHLCIPLLHVSETLMRKESTGPLSGDSFPEGKEMRQASDDIHI
jgi:hypothetical protein